MQSAASVNFFDVFQQVTQLSQRSYLCFYRHECDIDVPLTETRSFPPPSRTSARARSSTATASARRPPAIPRATVEWPRRSRNGSRHGNRCSTGNRRTHNGSSAENSTSQRTAWTGTSATPRATKPQSRAEGEPADRRAHADLLGSVSRSAAVRERPQIARRWERRSRRHLSPADSRGGRDARLRAHRR